ncbi:alpha/beta hydrolase [Bacillus sp. NP157]|nr:alpha/beta hydrolase [Bacillus sp. NP157]
MHNPPCRRFLTTSATLAASIMAARVVGARDNAPAAPRLVPQRLKTARHSTFYWETGPADGPLMVFIHGWPQIGLMWRAQMEAFASSGWRCIAPDMRGYGRSSAPRASSAYAYREIVADMVELHDHLGGKTAVWVGHDLGSPVAGALAAMHAERCRGVVLLSVPYFPDTFALDTLRPLVDRKLYPEDEYPDGQFDYYRFYLTHFDVATRDFDADIPSTLSAIYQPGDPSSAGKIYRSASISRNGGWFGPAHRAPALPHTPLWPERDFDVLVDSFRSTGFRPGNAWYLNDEANLSYVHMAPNGGHVAQPVLFVNGVWDPICDVTRNPHLGRPMGEACSKLSVRHVNAGHWLPLERKDEVVRVMNEWLQSSGLA